MFTQLSKAGLVAVSALGLASAGAVVTPYADGTCKTPIETYSYVDKNGTAFNNQPFDTGRGVSANQDGTWAFETYSKLNFDIPTSKTTLSQGVFWKIEQLDPTCRVIFMRPFHGADNIPGSIILNAGDGDGCYFTDPKDKIQMTFCCGTGDCSALNVGESALNVRGIAPADRATSGDNNGPSSSLAKVVLGKIPMKAAANVPAAPKKARHIAASGSLAARALKQIRDSPKTCGDTDTDCFNREWNKCHVKVTGAPVPMPGKQMSVSQPIDCTSSLESCMVSTTHTHTYSYEVSVSQTSADTTGTSSSDSSSETNTMEVTNTDGWSLSVSVGVGFGPFSASTDAGTSHTTTTDNTHTTAQEHTSSSSYASTVANTTGHSVVNAKGDSTSTTYPIMAGGYGYLTFTPLYDCYPIQVDCGEGHYFEWKEDNGDTLHGIRYLNSQICTPSQVNGQGDVQGIREVLYTNRS